MTSDPLRAKDGKLLRFSDSEKRKLEREAAKLFMRNYEKQFGIPARHIWHNEPAKPDISCYLNDEPLDLEIAHLYASEHEARLASGNSLSPLSPDRYKGDEHLWLYLSELASFDSDEKLQTALTRILTNKAHKSYQSERVWLVIRNASPLWQQEDFVALLPIVLPSHHFEQIWLLSDLLGHEPLIQLF